MRKQQAKLAKRRADRSELTLIGIGTFFAQASATGFVGRAAARHCSSASGVYLACYFFGGLIGSAALGQFFDRLGWAVCVAGIALALGVAVLLTLQLRGVARTYIGEL